MNGLSHLQSEDSEFVEVDPTGRYGRYNEILGKGASKTVYRGFDEYEGIEVAWNQVKLYDFLQSPEDLERLYCEIHLLKTLKHKNIMKFYTSWVDTANRNINFITEMFTSGTLRQYRLKHKRVNIRAVKHWCRQILSGLLYLHSHDPPVIHRDLKCDNIFINGNQGEVKIGDLGLAAVLRKSHAAHCVGTPEFMAPEVYEESYNELVDIYSFGMCILEMVTFEYPYSECTHPAQIYKKVISGKKPDALYKVEDPEVRRFVDKCLATVSHRLSARELLDDPFLQIDDCETNLTLLDCGGEIDGTGPLTRLPYLKPLEIANSCGNGYSNGYSYDTENEWGYHPVESEPNGIELFEYHEDEHSANIGISIKGKRSNDGGIFLRLRIADKEGRIRNIYFPFDIESDTALSVATEMVAELDITDQEVTKIADMIDGEIAALVPEWKPGQGLEETPRFANQNICHNCTSTQTSSGSFVDFLSNNPCCRHGCASLHGRFEEITFQEDESEPHLAEVAQNSMNQADYLNYQDIWGQHESCELTPVGSGRSHSDEECERLDPSLSAKDERHVELENESPTAATLSIPHLKGSRSFHRRGSLSVDLSDGCEIEIQQELRLLKANYKLELRKLRDQKLGILLKTPNSSNRVHGTSYGVLSSAVLRLPKEETNIDLFKSSPYDEHSHIDKSSSYLDTQMARDGKTLRESLAAEGMAAPKTLRETLLTETFCTGSLFPHSLHRTTALSVDAVDV